MGQGIIVECTICDYQDSFTLGVGMMYYSLENVIGQFSPYQRKKVLSMLHDGDVFGSDFEHKLFVCPKCNMLAGRFDFIIFYNGGQIYKPVFRCPECRSKLIPLKEPIEKTPCPACGNISLKKNDFLLWD